MPRYQSFDPNAEIIGRTVSGFIKSIMHDEIDEILKRHGLDHIDPQAWYPVQQLLDIYNDIAVGINVSPIFVSLGMAAAQIGLDGMSEEAKSLSLQAFFSNYDAVWQSRHRNGDVGHVKYEQINEDHIILTIKVPYPDDIFYGAFYTYARHFHPKNKNFSVAYDERIPTREHGGQETVIHIRLQA